MALSPSERISLIKEITARLSAEGWSLVDLTFSQFSIPTLDQFSGDKDAYIISMVEGIADNTLLELAQHVGVDFAQQAASASPPKVDPPFWRQGMFRVFLSHLSEHQGFAGDFQEAMLKYGISCFVAHKDIEPTKEWQLEIETALATCDALIAFLHPGFHKSSWTDQEIGFAMGRDVPTYAIRFGQDPYGFIGRFQAFSGAGKSADILASEIFDTYRIHKQTQSQIGEILIALFHESHSFVDAKARIGYLEELEVWQSSFSTQIQSAVSGNSQVRGSWGVPERVEALVKKWV